MARVDLGYARPHYFLAFFFAAAAAFLPAAVYGYFLPLTVGILIYSYVIASRAAALAVVTAVGTKTPVSDSLVTYQSVEAR